MAFLLDRNSLIAFNKESKISSISFQIAKPSKVMFFVKKEFKRSKKIRFSIVPKVDFLNYTKLLKVEGPKFLNFGINIDSKRMPDLWEGELIVDEDNFIRRIPIYLQRGVSKDLKI